jgi:GNAT superfamily N-acetyltransferase
MSDYSFDISQHCVRINLTEEVSSSDFSCGDDDLDDFFHNHALLYAKERLGKTYVFVNNDTSEIVAFFTVSNDSIKTTFIPKNSTNRVQRKIPGLKHLRTYPAVLIGRLGVSMSYQGKGFMIGRQIVNFIKLWFLDDDNKTGCRFLVVDAYNKPDALSFYERNGFKYLYASEEDERKATQVDSGTIHTRLMFLDLLHTSLF